MPERPTIDEIRLADEPERWRSLGFAVDGDELAIGAVRLRLLGVGAGRGMLGWSLRSVGSVDLDGLPTGLSDSPPPAGGEHPNGVVSIDHVVAFSPDLDRTVAALEAAGLPLRRIREESTPAGAPRQAFFRLGEVILECIQMPDAPDLDRSRGAAFWGLALRVEDIDRTAELLGARLGHPRPAVQEGRMIATLSRDAGSTLPLAFMTPPPVQSGSRAG